MGRQFAAQATDSAYNAYTERPAMLGPAGDVTGRHVLDLGCGAGHLAAALRERGAARIVGVDGSQSLLDAAGERLGDGAALHRHDLEEPLHFLADASFDLVVAGLVHHHLLARAQLLSAIRRVLLPGGTLLVSTTHPTDDRVHFGGSSFAEERVELPFGDGFALVPGRMTPETFPCELLGAGFVLEELREPRATEEARHTEPRRYDKTHHLPVFLCVRLRRP
ncbi:class I SAM-dependent methyltransferase [Streptomyces avicenniae]|uniref:class I SAM-dependent methyltransferase n=1 Tax=Streptomyces avicenniae TaxID=500153 RepID=UPI00069990DF|nr:class I SAM-dependent methyltransferase [Streptomyces avicenniae]